MKAVTPNAKTFITPAGTRSVVFAKDQPEYEPLPGLLTPDGKFMSQWVPTPEELARLNAGEPITLVVWTFRKPLQPLSLNVGGLDLT